jgi:signal transduction histidine kinase
MSEREIGPSANGVTPREQRLAAAGRVAGGLLHDFRNVLGPIANAAFLLEQQADNPERVRELAARLTRLARVQGRVTERLRDFLRQDVARFPDDAVVDLSAVARETSALCRTLAASRVDAAKVELECQAVDPLLVRGEGGDLRTVALELILNAVDALPQGGTVQVRTARAAGQATLEVQDDGKGLAEGVSETAFDPFISTKDEPDAGLGLSAAWGIAKRHGGDLTIETISTGGTLATLKLPLSALDT